MDGQLTIFDDWRPEEKPLPLGHVDNGEQLKGKAIPFRELRNYIGKKVLLEMPRQSAIDYKVIRIMDYYKDVGELYLMREYDENGEVTKKVIVDRVGFTDKERKAMSIGWIDEQYYKLGLGANDRYPECIYEIRR